MTHRMALAVVEMPKTVYKFTDTSIPDYVIATTADFSGEAKPCRNTDGTYRYFVRPGQGNTVTLRQLCRRQEGVFHHPEQYQRKLIQDL
jgi:hypothetical protein